MLVLDYIISNEDRHCNNFGFIRNAESLEWLGGHGALQTGERTGEETVIVSPAREPAEGW